VGPHAPTPKRSPVTIGDRAAHILTHHRATLRELHQRAARLEDRLLGGADRRFERKRDLFV
jgi:hypothetical protein